MKLAVRKYKTEIPCNYHYSVHPMAMRDDREAEMFDVLGYDIFEFKDETGEQLLLGARQALNHEVTVAVLVEKARAKFVPPVPEGDGPKLVDGGK